MTAVNVKESPITKAKVEALGDSDLINLLSKTPAEAEAWLNANVTTLPEMRTQLVALTKAVIALSHLLK